MGCCLELGWAYTLDCGPLPVEVIAEPVEPAEVYYFVVRWLVRAPDPISW